jgi:hypothetical protein
LSGIYWIKDSYSEYLKSFKIKYQKDKEQNNPINKWANELIRQFSTEVQMAENTQRNVQPP